MGGICRLLCISLAMGLHTSPTLAQISFLPISGSEGLAGNTGAARSGSASAPLLNPASAARPSIEISSTEASDEPESELSLSSNLYMLSKMSMRGGHTSVGEAPASYSSIPTSLGKRMRIKNADIILGLYQTENYQADYRMNADYGVSWGRMSAQIAVNRAGMAIGFREDKHSYGFGMSVSNYALKSNSQFLFITAPQTGALRSAWEERSLTDLSLSAGYITQINDDASLGFAVRAKGWTLFKSNDGQTFTANVQPAASASSIAQAPASTSNEINPGGAEAVVGVSIRGTSTKFLFDFAVTESNGASASNMAGELQARFGYELNSSEKNKWLFGLMVGLSDATSSSDLYSNRKAVPFTATVGLERDLGDSKRVSVGIFHNDSIDWDFQPTQGSSYSTFTRSGLMLSGALSL